MLPALIDESTIAQTFPSSVGMSFGRIMLKSRPAEPMVALNASAPTSPLLVILVIGETLRADHLGLNGYERNTTPQLSKLRPHLLSFTDVASTANYTNAAIHNLLTRAERHGTTSLVSVFREAGFKTAWISNQDSDTFAPDADLMHFTETDWSQGIRYDSVLLPPLAACLRQCGDRQFIVLHIMGSHFPYDSRYPAADAVYTPTFKGLRKQGVAVRYKQDLINSYDNSIHATDRFLAEVIANANQLAKPAIIVFTADHGENLYDDERKFVLHSGATPSRADTFVPLLVWANQSYRNAFPDKLQGLASNLSAPISHLDIMPTMLDLAQVRHAGQDAANSFASASFVPKPRRVGAQTGRYEAVESLR